MLREALCVTTWWQRTLCWFLTSWEWDCDWYNSLCHDSEEKHKTENSCSVFVHFSAHNLRSTVSLRYPTACWTIPHVQLCVCACVCVCVCVTRKKGGDQGRPQEGVTGRFITRWPTYHNDAWSPAGSSAWASEANATKARTHTHTHTFWTKTQESNPTSCIFKCLALECGHKGFSAEETRHLLNTATMLKVINDTHSGENEMKI